MVITTPGADEWRTSRVEIDPATGVWNRSGFLAAAGPLFDLCRRLERPVALMLFELRSTTPFGHASVLDDNLAVVVAERFRSGDVLGRVGPNRVAALLADCQHATVVSSDGLHTLRPPTANDAGLVLAIGIVHRAMPEGTLEQLLDDADAHLAAVVPSRAEEPVHESKPWRSVGHARHTRRRAKTRRR